MQYLEKLQTSIQYDATLQDLNTIQNKFAK
jgi:hypothetical protein